MSLEKAIEANTAAVLELCALVKQEVAGNQAVREVIAAATGKVAEAAEVKKTPGDARIADKSPSETPDPVAALKYCQDLAMRLFNEKGREVCMQVLSRFGVTKVSQLTADVYGDFIKKAQDVLGGAEV